MGDPGPPAPIPPRRPRGHRTGRQIYEVLLDPAVPTKLPGGSDGPFARTDRPHPPQGGDGRPPDAGPEQGRGTEDGCRLAPSLGPDCSGRQGPLGGRGAGTGFQLLNSEGVCDAADPAMLARLRELHPQAEGPTLEPPSPEDRPDAAPSWPSDKLLAMEAVVRSCPPGSAAEPSGLQPQHLLDCLNSADSAAKAGLLEALLTLVTTVSSGRLHPRAAPYLCAARLIPLRKKRWGLAPHRSG